jgi:N-acetylglucosamine-6-sulfatase
MRSADAGQPFALEVATFAPHAPYTPAPRDAADFPAWRAPRPPSFDYQNTDGAPVAERPRAADPGAGRGRSTPRSGSARRRSQAVDDLIGNIEATLQARGLADNTYIVFSSDNGYHMGEHRLLPGKMTAFDSDIRVPLVVAGPGVPAGATTTKIAENVDLRPTFDGIAGAPVSRASTATASSRCCAALRPRAGAPAR